MATYTFIFNKTIPNLKEIPRKFVLGDGQAINSDSFTYGNEVR